MAIEVFNRFEKKFLIHTNTYEKILNILHYYMDEDDYNKDGNFYTISNIYYDTEDNSLIRTSLSKPKYKEKLRLRAYGVPRPNDFVFLEIKKKVNKLVNKRRTTMNLQEAYSFIKTGQKPPMKDYMNHQVMNELDYFINRYELIPKLYLAYDRRAYFGKENHGLRISFDTNIRTRRYELKLEKGDFGEPLLAPDVWLMEIKAEKAIPLWLAELLSKHKVYSTSFSKYGTEYYSFIADQNRKENPACSTSYLIAQPMPNFRLQPQS